MFLIARCCVVTTNDLVEQSMSFLTYPPKNAKSKSKIEFILIKSQAHCAERWQSGRMRRTRNPVYGSFVSRVRIPLSPPVAILAFRRKALIFCDYVAIVWKIRLFLIFNSFSPLGQSVKQIRKTAEQCGKSRANFMARDLLKQTLKN